MYMGSQWNLDLNLKCVQPTAVASMHLLHTIPLQVIRMRSNLAMSGFTFFNIECFFYVGTFKLAAGQQLLPGWILIEWTRHQASS